MKDKLKQPQPCTRRRCSYSTAMHARVVSRRKSSRSERCECSQVSDCGPVPMCYAPTSPLGRPSTPGRPKRERRLRSALPVDLRSSAPQILYTDRKPRVFSLSTRSDLRPSRKRCGGTWCHCGVRNRNSRSQVPMRQSWPGIPGRPPVSWPGHAVEYAFSVVGWTVIR